MHRKGVGGGRFWGRASRGFCFRFSAGDRGESARGRDGIESGFHVEGREADCPAPLNFSDRPPPVGQVSRVAAR